MLFLAADPYAAGMGFFTRSTSHPEGSTRGQLCSCGTPLDLVDMDYGFQLPDEVFALPQDQRRSRIQGLAKVFVLDGSRGFVRTLLPVRLDHGSVRLGIWLETAVSQAQTAIEVWEEPAYASLVLAGNVANMVPPWGKALFGARATASPASQDGLPVVTSGDAVVRSMLERSWPRADLVAALPSLGHTH